MVLTMVGICCCSAKKNILHIFPLLQRLQSWMLSIPWILTNIALLLPPVFVERMYLSLKWLQQIIFFQLFSRPKVGLNPALMLEFCQFAMSLHLPLKTLMLLSLHKLWKTCWRWFLVKFSGNCLKVSWNSPPFF